MGDRRLDSLFRRYRARGDVAALGQLFDAVAPELLRVARHLCPDGAAAEDALQATFETALEKRAEFEDGRRVLPWMLGILAHHARKARRQAARAPDPERISERAPADPATVAADREFEELVDSAVAELPAPYAAVVGSYLRRERRPAEIASELGISANAASVRLYRGLKLLRRALPAGAALGGAAALRLAGAGTTRGLTVVRARVIEAAGANSAPGASAALTVATSPSLTPATLGAMLVQKPILTTTLAAILAGASVYALKQSSDTRQVRALNSEVATLSAELDEARSALGRAKPAGAVLAAPAPTRVSAADSEADEPVAPTTPTPAEWLARFLQAKSWRGALAIGYEIAALDSDEALAVMQAIFADIPDFQYRQQVLKPFVFDGGHVHALEILHLAASDANLAVQGWAWGYLENYAFQNFAEDRAAYDSWRARFAGMPLGRVLEQNAREFVGRVAGMSDEELSRYLDVVSRLDLQAGDIGGVDLSATMRNAGFDSLAERWLVSGSTDVRRGVLRWLRSLELDEGFLRRNVLPLATGSEVDMDVRGAALGVLRGRDKAWAFEPLLEELVRSATRAEGTPTQIALLLGEIGDPRAIPTMIGLIAADDTYRTRHGVGGGLGDLTGVEYHEDHGGAFWLEWWDRNRGSLPPEVQILEVPTYTIAH